MDPVTRCLIGYGLLIVVNITAIYLLNKFFKEYPDQ